MWTYTNKNRPEEVREAFKAHDGQMCISAVTLMELIYGTEASAAVDRNLRDIEGFATRLEVLPYNNEAAAHTGQLRAELRAIGRPIGPYDQMIAGHAHSQGLVVVTNNTKPFENLPGLCLANWAN
ncbi:MAG: tRNA(fMet)-specific endonuclease VapC [Marinobacter sp.]|uniref:tRNA(fMet)-specific endonuclease VapC n=1 Tax=Marinobacter sp. TaxID=50741 RepID=UPI00299E765B|nr:tRNA(fMet)-specific endonuclease VapC [Marinobacter sp.]MDX1757673.1 tRNA(fMet)-specific endonuclease VapC [Marinobacter sp.]